MAQYIEIGDWDACDYPVDAEALKGRECFAGIDLSSNVEITAVTETLYVWAIWDKELSSAERGVIKSNPRMNLNESLGAYNAGENLMHFWRFGADENDIGKDYADASVNKIDLMTNAVGIDLGDIVVQAP